MSPTAQVVAPDCVHGDTGSACNSRSFRARAWCRAEIMASWARNGTRHMFYATNSGLRSLFPDAGDESRRRTNPFYGSRGDPKDGASKRGATLELLFESLDVFAGAARREHFLGGRRGAESGARAHETRRTGELTCCRLKHPGGQPCDRESLVLPMLAPSTEIYAGRDARRCVEARGCFAWPLDSFVRRLEVVICSTPW